MYRVAIIVNENETLHSVYAQTENVLKKALGKVYYNKVDDIYSFEIFDKFNIFDLFEKGNRNIFTFDSIFVATNACNNKEIYKELVEHSDIISQYIDDGFGNYHGVCISNQQKLGASDEKAQFVGFLSDLFTYKLIKRKEKKSSDGLVTINSFQDWLVNFPIKIDNAIIEKCCSGENNQFMPHKYRYILSPNNKSTYEVIYEDNSYNGTDISDPRPLLLKSRVGNERIVISSIILDWAEHLEQLANIIVFITEGINQFAFVNKTSSINKRFTRYINKARDYNLPLKEYNEKELLEVLEGIRQQEDKINQGTYQLYPHSVFVFSNDWSEQEVNALWDKYVTEIKKDMVFYRLVSGNYKRKDELVLVSLFSKSIKNSHIFLSAEEWLIANYATSKWRKSIWTYEYVLNLYDYLSFSATGYISPLYTEIIDHYKIKEIDFTQQATSGYLDFSKIKSPESFKGLLYQTYDNVFNSTCSCCNVLARLYSLSEKNNIDALIINNQEFSTSNFLEDRNKCGNWIIFKLNSTDYSKRISWQDRLMAFVSLYESGYVTYIKSNNKVLYELLIEELKLCNSIFEGLFLTVDRITYNVEASIGVQDLCKILKYLYVVAEIIPNSLDFENLALAVEKKFLSEQSYNGGWKNLSETAEASIALLSRIKHNWKFNSIDDFESMISRAINYIQNSFNYDKSCWLDDENTTAKSLNAILFYDDIFNFAFDDFLVDLINATNKINPVFNVNNNIKALDFAQKQYNQLLYEKQKSEKSVSEMKKQKDFSMKLVKKYKLIVVFTAAAAALSVLFLVCMIGIFSTTYPEQWNYIVSENIAIVLATILGLVVTTVLTGIAQHAKTKLIEDYNKEESNL